MLTKEQKLAILSKAIDEGANIDINFHKLTRTNAALLTNEIAGMMGTLAVSKSGSGYQWYKAESPGIDVNAFYEPSYMVEDVKFEEEEVEV